MILTGIGVALSTAGGALSGTGVRVVVGGPAIGVGAACGIGALITLRLCKTSNHELYQQLVTLGQAKLSFLQKQVSKALSDESVSEEQFGEIIDEFAAYESQRSKLTGQGPCSKKREQHDRTIATGGQPHIYPPQEEIEIRVTIRPLNPDPGWEAAEGRRDDVLLLPALLLLLPHFSGLILSYNCDPPIQKINTLGTFLQLLLLDDSLYEAKLLQTLFDLYFLNLHWQVYASIVYQCLKYCIIEEL